MLDPIAASKVSNGYNMSCIPTLICGLGILTELMSKIKKSVFNPKKQLKYVDLIASFSRGDHVEEFAIFEPFLGSFLHLCRQPKTSKKSFLGSKTR